MSKVTFSFPLTVLIELDFEELDKISGGLDADDEIKQILGPKVYELVSSSAAGIGFPTKTKGLSIWLDRHAQSAREVHRVPYFLLKEKIFTTSSEVRISEIRNLIKAIDSTKETS